MPAGAIHMCVTKVVLNKLKIDISMNHYLGSIAPDSWRNSTSTKEGTHFIEDKDSLNYDYEYFYKKYRNDLDNEFVLGYLIHLITDRYWHTNNFITTVVPGDEYTELNKACSNLINKYYIQRLILPDNINNKVEELDISGLIKTIDYLNSVNYLEDKDSTFDIDELQICINKTADFVISELNRLYGLEYTNYNKR